jgi:hypothetical protein
MKESDIVRTICDYLALKKQLFWRNNNTPIYDPAAQRFRAMPKYTMKRLPGRQAGAVHWAGVEGADYPAAGADHARAAPRERADAACRGMRGGANLSLGVVT